MKNSLTFEEWFSRRSGERDIMMVSSRVGVLPCGCRVYRDKEKGTYIRKQSDGSWVHDCVTVTVNVVVPALKQEPTSREHNKTGRCWCGGSY